MKEQFRDGLHLHKSNIEKLEIVNSIIDDYLADGYRLTLRQLYYQLVVRNVIPNVQKEYAKLSGLLVKGRMAGEVDWDAIEDRIRIPYLPYWARGISDAIEDITNQYRLDRQEGQDNYIELFCEKDALSNVLKRVTSHYHIHLLINRGYSSCSAMYDAYNRLMKATERGQEPYILYLGDHDPSGLDMVRDIEERLCLDFRIKVEVRHIALTSSQIKKYNLPPNPAKFSDPRAKWYVRKFGKVSWEVDALNPKILNTIVEREIEELIDMKQFRAQLNKEKEHIKVLQKFGKKFK